MLISLVLVKEAILLILRYVSVALLQYVVGGSKN